MHEYDNPIASEENSYFSEATPETANGPQSSHPGFQVYPGTAFSGSQRHNQSSGFEGRSGTAHETGEKEVIGSDTSANPKLRRSARFAAKRLANSEGI